MTSHTTIDRFDRDSLTERLVYYVLGLIAFNAFLVYIFLSDVIEIIEKINQNSGFSTFVQDDFYTLLSISAFLIIEGYFLKKILEFISLFRKGNVLVIEGICSRKQEEKYPKGGRVYYLLIDNLACKINRWSYDDVKEGDYVKCRYLGEEKIFIRKETKKPLPAAPEGGNENK